MQPSQVVPDSRKATCDIRNYNDHLRALVRSRDCNAGIPPRRGVRRLCKETLGLKESERCVVKQVFSHCSSAQSIAKFDLSARGTAEKRMSNSSMIYYNALGDAWAMTDALGI
eukprot:5150032-Pleurochrysis_carterae.AAC.3